MKKRLILAAFLAIPLAGAISLGQSASLSIPAKHMQVRIANRQAKVNEWRIQATQQIVLTIAVGVFGLLVGALQKPATPMTRACTAALGLSVSAITICTKTLYTADFQTLRRAVDAASPMLERLSELPDNYESATSSGDKLQVQADFEAMCGKLDDLSHRLTGIEGPSDSPASKAQKSSLSPIFAIHEVYAQSQQTDQHQPSWTNRPPFTDGSGSYFVGVGRDSSLTIARSLAIDSASMSATNWVRLSQPATQQADISTQVTKIVQQHSEVSDTWFTRDKESGIWVYYSRLRLPLGLNTLSVALLDSDSPATNSDQGQNITLENDSAVFDPPSGLTLLLKHMGFAPISAEVYIISSTSPSPLIPSFSHDRKRTEMYSAAFASALGSCDGSHIKVGDETIWCFHLNSSSINPKKKKSQNLGSVAANNLTQEISAVEFNDREHWVKLRLQP